MTAMANPLAEQLAAYFKRTGTTQAQLAAKTGVSRGTINYALNGVRRSMSPASGQKLSAETGIDLRLFIGLSVDTGEPGDKVNKRTRKAV
jgi:transcriptional regulator with XRE-family HTH domain